MCGIRYPTMVDFVKEKIHARFVVDNKNPNHLRKTAFEKLNDTQIEIIRRMVCLTYTVMDIDCFITLNKYQVNLINFLKVHNIFRKCATKKKRNDPIEDLPFPTIASIHQTLLRHPLLPKYGVQTYRSILKSMGFQ